ncbi:hypothetical protein [Nocardioides sp.]|uniref:hypothetical protein n=1 Tax=Nocardioides sp. TaxID=35761 RepID=UPI0035157C76
MTKRPPAVDIACWMLWIQVVAGAAVCVMVVLRRDDLGAVWSPVQVGDSTVQPVEFVPVILVLYSVTAILALTLIALFRSGHRWARHGLGSIAVGIFLVSLGTVRTDPPLLVDWTAVLAAVLSAVSLVFLWHPQSRRWVGAPSTWGRPRRAEDRDADRGSAPTAGAGARSE